ncbi:MAG: hypothetical protein ABI612_10035 [Betaproteobacteria bacterium]
MAQHDPLPNGIKGVQVAAGATDSGTTGAGTGTAGTGTGATTSPAGGDSSAPGTAGAGPARTGATDNTGNPAGAGASNTGAGGVDGGKGVTAGTLIDETTQPTIGANDQAKDEGANKRGTPASASHGKDTDATDTSSGKSATPRPGRYQQRK